MIAFDIYFDGLRFWQWQILIALSILVFNTFTIYLEKRLLSSPKLIEKRIALIISTILNVSFIWFLVDWTWSETQGKVFIFQMLNILILAFISREWINSYPISFYILCPLFFMLFIFFCGYQSWKKWDLNTYQCRPPECPTKEKVICNREGSREECYTEKTKKLFSFEHCVTTSGMLPSGYGPWKNITCYDQEGNIISEDDWD